MDCIARLLGDAVSGAMGGKSLPDPIVRANAAFSRRGHTLAELMVVMTILVLFALIVGPRVLTSLYPAKLDTAVSAVQADIDYARARATGTGIRHQLVIATETGEIQVVPYRMDGSEAVTGQNVPESVLRDRLDEDVKVTEWTITPMAAGGTEGGGALQATDVLTFYPEGVSDSAVLVLEDAQGNRRGLQLNGYTGELRELTAEELPPR